jgi:GNAT superfamily N-acetyltransferase
MAGVIVRQPAALGDREVHGLGDVLIDCVEGGASVSFMWPMTRDKADAYWCDAAASVARGERIVLTAEEADGSIIGTVTLVTKQPENQPHRADLAKMLVHRRARRRGVGDALLGAAENAARAAGKTLLVLDTASPEAARLYERHGWVRCGEIPFYALMPDGAPCATILYYRVLG